MDAETHSLSTPARTEASLVRGGPFYRAEEALGFIGPNRWYFDRALPR
jgi:hypothetical protein